MRQQIEVIQADKGVDLAIAIEKFQRGLTKDHGQTVVSSVSMTQDGEWFSALVVFDIHEGDSAPPKVR